jgi:hypothetical protein
MKTMSSQKPTPLNTNPMELEIALFLAIHCMEDTVRILTDAKQHVPAHCKRSYTSIVDGLSSIGRRVAGLDTQKS